MLNCDILCVTCNHVSLVFRFFFYTYELIVLYFNNVPIVQYCDLLSCLLLFFISFNIILRFHTKQNVIPYLIVCPSPTKYFL